MIKQKKSKFEHFKSENHISFENSIISRYNNLNPDFNIVDEIIRKCINTYIKKFDDFGVHCLLKLFFSTNIVKHIRISTKSSSVTYIITLKKLILSRMIKKTIIFLRYSDCN